MAKNWKMNELTEVFMNGNKEDITDVTRRFPLTSLAVSASIGNKGAETIINAIPEYISVRKIEAILKGDSDETEAEAENEEKVEEEVEVEEKPSKKEKVAKKAEAKVEKVEELEELEEPEEDEEIVDGYNKMSAKELFSECKKRGIKVKPRQDKEVYIDLLEADDNKPVEVEEEDEWDI